jgi:hypothetical protein
MPGHRKVLPRPCPQCGAENGGVQLVFFNPRFYKQRTGYSRSYPYHLLRISHYSKDEYGSKKNKNKKYKPTKIWHTFQFTDGYEINYDSEPMSVSELFDQPEHIDKQSYTVTPNEAWLNYYRKNGWPRIKTESAHWINKPGPKKCQMCNKFDSLKKCFIRNEDEHTGRNAVFSGEHIWLCKVCYLGRDSGSIRKLFCSLLTNSGYHPYSCTSY